MKNKELLTGLLLTTVVVGGVGVSFANDSTTSSGTTDTFKEFRKMPELTDEQKAEMDAIKTIMDKKKSGETLTTEEQTKLDAFEANRSEGKGFGGDMGGKGHGRGHFMGQELTDAEKTALQSMTDDEKKIFFEQKITEAEAKMIAEDNVIDKLLAGQTLTSDEETVRQEIIKERADRKEKKAEMDSMRTIMGKKKNGETLTSDEQAKLDTFEANRHKKSE
ncbi:MAG: hypothetical protein PHN31_02385 [Candidatus Gracilibacteria bacterium]|nr:hypothetical protein [Candidatus Gracilibacteria bacterium]